MEQDLSEAPAHAWLRPRLEALLAEAERAGFSREVAVAVLTDLIEGPGFNAEAGSSKLD